MNDGITPLCPATLREIRLLADCLDQRHHLSAYAYANLLNTLSVLLSGIEIIPVSVIREVRAAS